METAPVWATSARPSGAAGTLGNLIFGLGVEVVFLVGGHERLGFRPKRVFGVTQICSRWPVLLSKVCNKELQNHHVWLSGAVTPCPYGSVLS